MNEFFQFVVNHWALWLAFVLLLIMMIQSESGGKVRGVQRVSPQEMTDLMNHHKAVVLDVRSEEDFKVNHISGSKNIPFDEIESSLDKVSKQKEKPIVIICAAGVRATAAGVLLRKHGFLNVHSLNGGLKTWQSEGLPLIKE